MKTLRVVTVFLGLQCAGKLFAAPVQYSLIEFGSTGATSVAQAISENGQVAGTTFLSGPFAFYWANGNTTIFGPGGGQG